MIDAFRTWMTSLVAVSLLISVIQAMTPHGNMKRIVSMLSGLVLLLAMMQPILRGNADLRLPHKDDCQEEITRRTEELKKEQVKTARQNIEAKTAAYISDEAKRLGISCTVRVGTAIGKDGVPRPDSAALSCAPSEKLATYMEKELGIPRRRQTWNEKTVTG